MDTGCNPGCIARLHFTKHATLVDAGATSYHCAPRMYNCTRSLHSSLVCLPTHTLSTQVRMRDNERCALPNRDRRNKEKQGSHTLRQDARKQHWQHEAAHITAQ